MSNRRINFYVYDDLNRFFNRFAITNSKVENDMINESKDSENVDKELNFNITFTVDGYFLSLFFNVINSSSYYRKLVKRNFLNYLDNIGNGDIDVRFYLVYPKADILDYKWNYRMITLFREKQQLEYSMSWLSTLGGAFSALGDSFEHCAKTAGKISVQQFQIALKLGDPPLVARCKLYMALSLIQQRKLKVAKKIIEEQYELGKNYNDFKLMNMCKGIWAKLKYTYILEQLKKNTLIT